MHLLDQVARQSFADQPDFGKLAWTACLCRAPASNYCVSINGLGEKLGRPVNGASDRSRRGSTETIRMDSRLRQLTDELFEHANCGVINPGAISAGLLPHVFMLDIENGATAGTIQLRIRLTGTAVDQIFDRPICGHLLEEYVHGPRGEQVIKGFHHCALTREAIWMRQVAQFPGRATRFVEGIAVHVVPGRIVGGLLAGEVSAQQAGNSFEREILTRVHDVAPLGAGGSSR